MTEIGEQGDSFNFSSASRAANFRPDIERIKQYDPYRQKYVCITRIVVGIGLLTAGFTVRLWTTGNSVWAVVVGVVALLIMAIPDEEWTRLDSLTRELPRMEDNQVAFFDAGLRFVEAK